MNKKTKIFLSLLPIILVFVLIFVFSSFDATSSSSQSARIVRFIKKYIFPDLNTLKNKYDIKIVNDTASFIVRKIAHLSIYTLLGMFTFAGLWPINNKKARYFTAVGICMAYAVTDEIHQLYVPGRSCEIRDVLIDTCGSAVGALICLVIVLLLELRRIKKRQRRVSVKRNDMIRAGEQ